MIRTKFFSVLLAFLIAPAFALAGELQPFDAAKFEQLQADGKPVAVVVHATWCPVCQVQVPIQTELMRSPEFADLTMFTMDFDKDKDLLRRFNVVKQSAIIVFKGEMEVARTLGETQRENIRATLLKAKG